MHLAESEAATLARGFALVVQLQRDPCGLRGPGQVARAGHSGGGVAPFGLPLPGQDPRPHSSLGQATHLGRYTGDGTVETDSAAFDPATGTAVLHVMGGCKDCDASALTFMQGIEVQLKRRVSELKFVVVNVDSTA